jgi:nitrogen fixation NifU-like protein
MEQKSQDFWQRHSMRFLEMALRRDRCRSLTRADGRGRKTGDCGDTIEVFLELSDDRLSSVCYQCEGCLNTHACCNTVAQLAEEKSVEEAWNIMPEDVAEYLETLPPDHFHCAELAVGAFYLALRNAETCKPDP